MPWTPGDFYGEALPIAWARDETGNAIATGSSDPGDTNGTALTYFWNDNHTLTASAGDSFLCEVYPDYIYLTPSTPTVFTLVVELAAGSSGTFRVKSGSDPAWNLTSPALATNDCGTFTAAGAGRVLVPIANYTTSLIYDFAEEPLLFIEVLTGTVVIKQLRVRMWPPTGPLGNWASDPDFTYDDTQPAWTYVSGEGEVEVNPNPENVQNIIDGWGPEEHITGPGAWGGWTDTSDGPHNPPFLSMVAAMRDAVMPTYQYFRRRATGGATSIAGSYGYSWLLKQIVDPSHEWSGRYTSQCVMYLFEPLSQNGRDAGLTYNDPDRVPWDDAAGFRDGTSKGTVYSKFDSWIGTDPTLSATTGSDTASTIAASVAVNITALTEKPVFDATNVPAFGVTDYMWNSGTAAGSGVGTVYGTGSQSIALPDQPYLKVEISPIFLTTAPTDFSTFNYNFAVGVGSTTAGSRTFTFTGVKPRHLYNDLEYFDPSLAWTGDGGDPVPGGSGIIPGWVEVFGSTGGGGGTGTSLLSDGGPCIDCGRLGVGVPRVFLYDRGGTRRIAEITDLAVVRWSRVRDDISSATVIVNSPSRECCALLAAISVGRHEIVVYRDNDRVWEGPITRVSWKASTVEVTAHDICHYISRTIMRSAYDNRYAKTNSKVGPVTTRAQVILQHELKRKEALSPAYNILRFLDVRTHEKTTRTSRFTPPYYSTVWEEMDYMAARLSLDYTTIGRRLILFDTHDVIGRSQMLTDKDFTDELIVTSYGMELATRSAVTDGEGHWAAVGGVDPYYGEVELLNNTYGEEVRPENPTAPTKAELAALAREMASQAQRNLAGRYPIPTVVRIPDGTQLDPSAPICINGLVPGIRVPIRTTLACLDLQQEQKLDSVTASWDASGEKVSVTLSPAPGTTPWDDESESSEEE